MRVIPILRAILLLAALIFICAFEPSVDAATSTQSTSLGIGSTFSVLQVGSTTYHDVSVRSITVRSLVISHRDGLGSIRLRDLPVALQKAFGYSPEAEATADVAAKTLQTVPVRKPAPSQQSAPSKFDILLRQFGQSPEILLDVDLSPHFIELGLYAKNQGRRPSCAIFAVVSALEFQNAELLGHSEKLSEEYLIWATRKILGRDRRADVTTVTRSIDDEDEGFAISEVVAALRTYGIPLEERMPDTLGKKMQDIADPSPALIDEARRHCHVATYPIPQTNLIGNLVQSLNSGVPIVVGLKWPNYVASRAGYLNLQQPMIGYGHAVTLVGYHCTTQSLDDVVFLFKNSWGVQWGAGGFGHATTAYLKANLTAAVILEVQRAKD